MEFSQLRDMSTEPIYETAGGCAGLSDLLSSGVSAVNREAGDLTGSWEGVDADAAIARVEGTSAPLDEASQAFDMANQVLQQLAGNLDSDKARLDDLIAEAQSIGTVNDNGVVVPAATADAATDATAQQRAGKLTARIAAVVEMATQHDREARDQLNGRPSSGDAAGRPSVAGGQSGHGSSTGTGGYGGNGSLAGATTAGSGSAGLGGNQVGNTTGTGSAGTGSTGSGSFGGGQLAGNTVGGNGAGGTSLAGNPAGSTGSGAVGGAQYGAASGGGQSGAGTGGGTFGGTRYGPGGTGATGQSAGMGAAGSGRGIVGSTGGTTGASGGGSGSVAGRGAGGGGMMAGGRGMNGEGDSGAATASSWLHEDRNPFTTDTAAPPIVGGKPRSAADADG